MYVKFSKLLRAKILICLVFLLLLVGGAKILGSVKAGNGIVHVIDKVMLPPSE